MRKKVSVGLVLILLGIGFFLQQADILQFSHLIHTGWPIILILIGITQLTNRNKSSSVPGILFITVGGLFFANTFISFNIFKYSWPIAFIVVGLIFIFSRTKFKEDPPTNNDRFLESFSLFSGTELKSYSDEFEGGTITTIFGGAEIDLRDVSISSHKGATLELTTLFGGIELRVPENMNVTVSGIPIFGAWENKTKKYDRNEANVPTLHVHCTVIFGGVEIKD